MMVNVVVVVVVVGVAANIVSLKDSSPGMVSHTWSWSTVVDHDQNLGWVASGSSETLPHYIIMLPHNNINNNNIDHQHCCNHWLLLLTTHHPWRCPASVIPSHWELIRSGQETPSRVASEKNYWERDRERESMSMECIIFVVCFWLCHVKRSIRYLLN